MTKALSPRKLLALLLSLYGLSTLIAMAPMSIGAGLAILGILGFALADPRHRQALRPVGDEKIYLWLCLGLTAVAALSLICARAFPLRFSGRELEIEFLKDLSKVWYLFWPLLLTAGFAMVGTTRFALVRRGWFLGFVLLSVIGVAQFFTGWPRPQPIPGFEPYFHATLGLGHHLSVASIWIFPFFALLETLTNPPDPQDRFLTWRPMRVLLTVGLIAGGGTLFLTFSRMGWVAFGVSLLLWFFWRFTQTWPKNRKIAVFCVVLAGVGAVTQLAPIQNRLRSGIGIQERLDLWNANIEFFKLRPWTGIGFRQTEELAAYYLQEKKGVQDVFAGHAHNNLLEVLSGTGIFGAVLWLALQALIFALILKLPPLWRRAFFCAFLAFHINGLTQVNFWEGKVQHQLAWVIAWIFVLRRRANSSAVGATSD